MSRGIGWRSAARTIVLILPILFSHPIPGFAAARNASKPFADFDLRSVPRPERGGARPVARVFERYIYGDSLGAPGAAADDRGAALSATVMRELLRRLAAEEHIEATPAEIDDLLGLMIERDPSFTRTPGEEDREIVSGFITRWKIDRSLYHRYGGKVIFQQLDPLEPVGAYGDFLKEMRKRKVFEIYDRSLERGFWRYFTMNHPFEIPPERVNFDIPWWLQGDGAQEAPGAQAQREPEPAAPTFDIPPEGYTVTGELVRFVFDPSRFAAATNGTTGSWASLASIGIQTVHLAGDFNGWSTSAWLMRPVGPTGSIYVLERTFDDLGKSGRHEFKFVVNRQWWVEPVARAPNRAETNLGNRSGNLTIVIP